jgi:cell division protease FtsH
VQNTGDYSEATSQTIDSEIQHIISSQYKVALDILKEKKDVLAKGALLLLEKEKIDSEDLKALMQAA